jgi:hypothetical protein
MREFNITINLTFSKIMAAGIFIGAICLDFANDKSGTVFMFSLPFVVFLITGKQYFDKNKPEA